MKFIGQFIQNLVSRFRNDVFLENISSGTIASGGNLGLDSNNKIVKANEATGDIEGVTAGTNLTGGGTSGTVTINLADASTSAKGAASFSSDNFAASSGAITIKSGGVDLTDEVTGTLPLANGGTGQTSAQAALDALAGGTTSGRYLRGDGSNIVLGAIQTGHVPTLNQDTTGSAATLTTARAFQTDLASTSSANFDGSAANTHGVTGTLASGNATGLVASTSNSIGVGSIELGHASDTTIARSAAGKITVEGKEVRTADRQIQAVYSSFQANDIETKHYLAFNDGDSENTDHSHVDMPIVAPFAGKLLSVSIRQTRNTSTHNYTIRLETQAVGVAHATGPSIVGTQTGSAPTNTSIVTYDFSGVSSNAISAGDYVYISIESDTAPGGTTKYFFTCLFEWDYSSI
jgi:hypothetical protein